ncbi:MAG: phosphate acetyltransferase [bacterium]
MDLIKNIKEKAKKNNRTIILPEGGDERVIKASELITKEGIARVVLLGDEERIRKRAGETGVSLEGVDLMSPKGSDKFPSYAKAFYALRKSKGITSDQAREIMEDPLYFGCMMLREGDADGVVGGCVNTTASTVRAALQVVGLKAGRATLSSCFLMIVPDSQYGNNGTFIFADCGVVPDPSSRQLAAIAISSAESARVLLSTEPYVAMLSFSTRGSAKDPSIDKIREALSIARKRNPELVIDGEFQVDTALVPSVAKRKAPDTKVAGRANVLIFPDLNSGNIGYKLVQRLAKAQAYGPILQGLAKPVNDLSRGCSAEDIVNVVAITAIQ